MSKASVDGKVIHGSIRYCRNTIMRIEKYKHGLESKLFQVSNVWSDDKYLELKCVIDDCTNAISRVLAILNRCVSGLDNLERYHQEYESIILGSSQSSTAHQNPPEDNRRAFVERLRDGLPSNLPEDQRSAGVRFSQTTGTSDADSTGNDDETENSASVDMGREDRGNRTHAYPQSTDERTI